MDARIIELAPEFAAKRGMQLDELLSAQDRDAQQARFELFWRCRQLHPQPSYVEIGRALGFDKATVLNGVRRHEGGPAKIRTGNR